MTIPIFDLSVRCGFFCQGGSPQFDQTEYPDNYSVVKYPDHLAAMQREREVREKLVAVLESAREWMIEEGCDCGVDEPESCALCLTVAALLAAKELEG